MAKKIIIYQKGDLIEILHAPSNPVLIIDFLTKMDFLKHHTTEQMYYWHTVLPGWKLDFGVRYCQHSIRERIYYVMIEEEKGWFSDLWIIKKVNP